MERRYRQPTNVIVRPIDVILRQTLLTGTRSNVRVYAKRRVRMLQRCDNSTVCLLLLMTNRLTYMYNCTWRNDNAPSAGYTCCQPLKQMLVTTETSKLGRCSAALASH